MKSKLLETMFLIFSISISVFSQARFIVHQTACEGMAQIWLSNMDLTSQRQGMIRRRINIQDTFSVKKTLNMYVNFYWLDNEKQHIVKLKYVTPSGHLYQTEKVPVSIDGKGLARMQLPGYRFPVKVKKAKKSIDNHFNIQRMKITSIPFPIGGTYISKNSLFGKWTLYVYIDNREKPCAVLFFTIKR